MESAHAVPKQCSQDLAWELLLSKPACCTCVSVPPPWETQQTKTYLRTPPRPRQRSLSPRKSCESGYPQRNTASLSWKEPRGRGPVRPFMNYYAIGSIIDIADLIFVVNLQVVIWKWKRMARLIVWYVEMSSLKRIRSLTQALAGHLSQM